MKKWLMLLALALLFNVCARAEDAEFYTNKSDLYYHADPDCDRPPEVAWHGREREIYEREIYRKYPISAEAAEAFGKAACPVCVKEFEPVYLGEYPPEGDVAEPWSANVGSVPGSDAYCWECAATHERFEAYFEETYDWKTNSFSRKHPFPDAFAGIWYNCTGGYTYAIVDPTQEILDNFERLFGGGAWIVPAKFGENEMSAMQEELFPKIVDWCRAHPELDAQAESASVNVVDGGFLEIGLAGEDWKEAAAGIDAEFELPVWVMFHETTPVETV